MEAGVPFDNQIKVIEAREDLPMSQQILSKGLLAFMEIYRRNRLFCVKNSVREIIQLFMPCSQGYKSVIALKFKARKILMNELNFVWEKILSQ